jgi:Fur family ferric uptake transcriptional regulator
MTAMNPIVQALDAAGYRLTGQRRALANLITEQGRSFTAADLEIVARERRIGLSRATLFRALGLLAELQVVERLDLPTGRHAYVPCTGDQHHLLICSRCGMVVEVADRGVAETVAEIARGNGFRIDRQRLEFFGLCRRCQATATADA